jgi:cell division protein FtsB
MLDKEKFLNHPRLKQLLDVRNLALYVFGLVVLAITWSGIKTMQSNYDLQKQIATLQQQNEVIKLENENSSLSNQFYQTDQYLDLSARQNLGLAAPGETVLLVPKSTAQKYVDQTIPSSNQAATKHAPSKYVQNLEDWRDFLLGRKLFSN